LRAIRYYDPATWKPGGNWGNGRYIKWSKKTTRPFEMWPEVWYGISKNEQHLAIREWREEVKRRAVLDKAARKRKIIRERSGVPDHVGPPPAPVAMAMEAETIDFEAWKPWLHEVYKLCDLKVPEMPLLKDHIKEHMLPPKHRQKYNTMPWNRCVARPVFKDEIRRSPGAQAALRKEWDRLRQIDT
jgi:hypothetical protein